MKPRIRFESVSKSFRVSHQRPFLVRELLRNIFQTPSAIELHWALRDISFDVDHGQSIGVIGPNGAGKSTLLSLIAKTTHPSSGTVTTDGRIAPLLELGAGFHPDLTGYENIFLNASLLGLSRRDVNEQLDSIVDYSGIEKFIDAPVQTYSSGMVARLGFAVIAHANPDILIIDESLAVGDANFQAKCAQTLRSFREAGKTLFLVSHSEAAIRDLCDLALWLEGGKLQAMGDAEEICKLYFDSTQTVVDQTPS